MNAWDGDGDLLTYGLVTGPSNGTVVFNSDGTWTYTPNERYVGPDSFTWRAYDSIEYSNVATVAIDVVNVAPVFDPVDELDTGVREFDGGADLRFGTGEIIGQLGAFDADADQLTFAGDSPYFHIHPDGRIEITDGAGLMAQFTDGGQSLRVAVTVTDGIETVASEFVLSSKSSWLDQNQIYVEESNGTEHWPTTATGLLRVLREIRGRGNSVSTLIIKGHGGSSGIQVGDDGEYLTTTTNLDGSTSIYIGGEEATDLLNDVTGAGTTISLRGCFSYRLAVRVQRGLDGATVWGAVRFVIGIPGTTWDIGIYR